jgi:hypothetical protein
MICHTRAATARGMVVLPMWAASWPWIGGSRGSGSRQSVGLIEARRPGRPGGYVLLRPGWMPMAERIWPVSCRMDVVGHQAVAQHLQAVPACLLSKHLQVHLPVVVDQKDRLAVVAAMPCCTSRLNVIWTLQDNRAGSGPPRTQTLPRSEGNPCRMEGPLCRLRSRHP